MGASRKEREMVADWAILMHASGLTIGDLIGASYDHESDWYLSITPQQFADKWADTIEGMSNHLVHIVTKEVPGTPIKVYKEA